MSCTLVIKAPPTTKTEKVIFSAEVFNPIDDSYQDASCKVKIAGRKSRWAYYSYDVNGHPGFSHGIHGANGNLVFKNTCHMGGSTLFTMDRCGNFTACSDVAAYSDARLKKDIVAIPDALDKISKIGGYTYTRIDSGAKQAGVLAQEMLEVLPEVVHTNEDGMYSVSYGNIVALLIEALKQERQQREAVTESLEKRISELEKNLTKQ